MTGQGLNDYDAIFSILKDSGFDGWVSIEDGMNGMAEMQQSLDFFRMRAFWYEKLEFLSSLRNKSFGRRILPHETVFVSLEVIEDLQDALGFFSQGHYSDDFGPVIQ